MAILMYSLSTALVASGFFGDELEVCWLRECWAKAFDKLEGSNLEGAKGQVRWRRLDFSLSRALQGMVRSSGIVVGRCHIEGQRICS